MPTRNCRSLDRNTWSLLLALSPVLVWAQTAEITTLENADAIQQRIREYRQQGNAEEAWNREQELLALALRNLDDVRSARIFRELGDHRMDTLQRYNAGEFPPEIVLGCYYNNARQYSAAFRAGSQTVNAAPVSFAGNSTCASGSNRTARLALGQEALWLYRESARILRSSERAGPEEINEAFMTLLTSSYQMSNYSLARWSLRSLLSFEEASSVSPASRAETIALMADLDLLFAGDLGTRLYDSAEATYSQAIDLLVESGLGPEAVDSIFSPQTPILLPTFRASPLMTQSTADSARHVDISFEIRKNGKTSRVKLVDSSNDAPRDIVRDIMDTISTRLFRPIAVDGRLQDRAPVTVRFYFNE